MRLKHFKMYVANRVTEILEGSSVTQWCQVASEWNLTNMCSRGVASPKNLLKNQRDQQKSWDKGKNFFGITYKPKKMKAK